MSLLSIGVSGLNVSQTMLKVTGNNIANANNPAYSRQRAELATTPEQFTGEGYLGSGANVSDISRIVDKFLINQISLDTATFNNLESFTKNIEQLDSLLADEQSGLSPGIDLFYSAIETAAQDPTSMPARQLVLSNSEGLVERFQTLFDRLNQQNVSVNDEINALTGQINSLAVAVANLNADIEVQIARSQGSEPSAAMDAREELVRQLSELVSVQVTEETSGAVNIFIGNGQNLVVGSQSNTMGTAPSERNPGSYEITFTGQSGVSQEVTDFMNGGKIGGLLDYRDNVLNVAYNEMGRIAIGMATAMNDQNQKGIDLEGNLGGLIFRDISTAPQVIADGNNNQATPTAVTASIEDINQLTTSDYLLVFTSATDYQIVRQSDKTSTLGTIGGPLPQTINIDGLDIEVGGGGPNTGDRFYVRPTRFGANLIQLELQRPQEFALASPVRAQADIGNVGTGVISSGEVVDMFDSSGAYLPEFATPGQLSPPIMVRFSSSTAYDLIDNSSGATISSGNAFIPGIINTISVGSPAAYQFEIDGEPAAGDEFTIDFNGNGIGDNRNAILMGELRSKSTLDSNGLNFEDAYGRLVEKIGASTAQAQISRDAAESLLFQTRTNRDELSGVSMEEEAANLIQFEQSYNANAQVISVARQLFDTLLSVF